MGFMVNGVWGLWWILNYFKIIYKLFMCRCEVMEEVEDFEVEKILVVYFEDRI